MGIEEQRGIGMKFGVGLGMMNSGELSENTLYADTVITADLAEALGFSSVWTVEHHFSGHSPVPNGLHLLSHIAGRTERLMLGTAVLVLPWHDPIRVAEEIAMLDLLSCGRTLIGFGRGTAPQEFDGFGVPMEQSRERFKEALLIVQRGLSGERFSFAGDYRNVNDLQIRPMAKHKPETRFYGAASNQTSVAMLSGLGLGMMVSPDRDLANACDLLSYHRKLSAARKVPVPGPMSHLYISIAEREADALARAKDHVPRMVDRLDRHYGISKNSLRGVKGYEHHANKSWKNEAEKACTVRSFIDKQIIGTPAQCIARISEIDKVLGIEHFVLEFGYGAMARDEIHANMQLFAEQVMPAFRPRSVTSRERNA
jgi:alkanesulfonate monooxygenase SsuD/methylene tetrahydromethanopterin reductase-like flavin-dependent oxidoreductase (luciferase family)